MQRRFCDIFGLKCLVLGAVMALAAHGCGGNNTGARPRPGSGTGGIAADSDGGGGSVIVPSGPADVVAIIDLTSTHQTLEGFGAAVAFVTNFLSAQSGDIYKVLFVDSGLDILRLGNWFQNQQDAKGNNPTVDAAFADYDGVHIVQKATAARGGQPLKILMSSWSPPAYLKSNGMTKPPSGSGTSDAGRPLPGTLMQNGGAYAYAGFGDWWVRSLQAYAAQGVVPDYISIQNEPDFYATDWETCLFAATEGGTVQGIQSAGYGQALEAVYGAIQGSNLAAKPLIVGPESLGIGGSGMSRYMGGMNSAEFYGVAHHLYSGGIGGDNPAPDSFAKSMTAVATLAAGKPTFMTEYSPGAPNIFDTAWLMHNALTVEGVSAYIYWELIWAGHASPVPLVSIASASPNSTYTVNENYYALKHFAKWTDPGWVRVDGSSPVAEVKISAFVSPDGTQLTVVLLNTDSIGHVVAVNPGAFVFSTVAAYRSSGASERAASAVLGDDGGVGLPSRSIATLVFGP
jgi:glucuronoarabinoxylan endo-1,4-beta-xylanase